MEGERRQPPSTSLSRMYLACRRVASAVSEPALEVAAVDDAEDEEYSVVGDDVVEDAVVAGAQAVEGVSPALDRFHLLAADAAGSGGGFRELFECSADALSGLRRELLVCALG